MAEYIKREEVITQIKEYALNVYGIDLDDPSQFAGKSVYERFCEGLYEATEVVNDIPTVDVASVVRCKDCKYNIGTKKCLNPDSFFAVPKDDDFCSYGKRKDGDTTNESS